MWVCLVIDDSDPVNVCSGEIAKAVGDGGVVEWKKAMRPQLHCSSRLHKTMYLFAIGMGSLLNQTVLFQSPLAVERAFCFLSNETRHAGFPYSGYFLKAFGQMWNVQFKVLSMSPQIDSNTCSVTIVVTNEIRRGPFPPFVCMYYCMKYWGTVGTVVHVGCVCLSDSSTYFLWVLCCSGMPQKLLGANYTRLFFLYIPFFPLPVRLWHVK